MSFDISLRDNGASAFDIALSESADSSASFAGTSSFSGNPSEIETSTGIFAGTSSFSGTPTVEFRATASFAGTSSFSGTPAVEFGATASFAGTSSFSGTPTVEFGATASFAGTSSFSADPSPVFETSGTFAGTSSFSGSPNEVFSAVGSFSGTSLFTASPPSFAQVASDRPEIVASISGNAGVASDRAEIVAAIAGNAAIASNKAEIVAAFPVSDPYAPAIIGGGSACGGGYYEPASTIYEPDCCSFYQPSTGYYRPGSGYGIPDSSSGVQSVLLAFTKEAADAVVLATVAQAGFYPTGGLSAFSWVQASSYDGAGNIPIMTGMNASVGWQLAAVGTASPSQIAWQYQGTGAVLEQDIHTYSGGDLRAAGWVSAGGFRSGTAPYPLRAFVDEEVGSSTNGTLAPATGSTPLVTLLGNAGGTGALVGSILSPLLIAADLGSGGGAIYQDAYFDDLGRRRATSLFENPDLVLAPRARSSVLPGDPVTAWAVDPSGIAVSGPTVTGVPSKWRGPGRGLQATDEHYLTVPWVSTSLATGKTLVVGVQGSTVPGTSPACVVGRATAGTGGVQISITTSNGLQATITAYDAGGVQRLSLTLNPTAFLGQRVYYVLRIAAGGTGSCSAIAVSANGTLQSQATGTPTAALALATQRWGRNESAGHAYSQGFLYDWIEIPAVLSNSEVAQLVNGTYSGTISQWLAGVDGNVIDDADQQIFWNTYDPTGTYGSAVRFTSIGGPAIVPGS